ncbi:hypothetical protein ACFSQ7_09630 [Paenibacillus rhizoplanae]
MMLYYARKLRNSEEKIALYESSEARLPLLKIYKDIFQAVHTDCIILRYCACSELY